ncbi:hypothetical protein GWK47_021586 [Chionoecetes opilio]|uniref:Uncharacterized protein n=1 Tax=Chionoecetes opilio TaxID=41210 RepID=A0A8J5CEA9_CHIOP|nr:hypothetical protein GWK47_021586 [Chionoecetes opilio]
MGRHSFELLRASRLVVDTGMHALGWSRDKAVTFLLDHTALSIESIQGEINRYITWPGQACAYKVGEIKIKELRQKAQNALGSLFRLSDFHDEMLGCIGPLKIVEECITNYIEQTNLVIEKGAEEKREDEKTERSDKKMYIEQTNLPLGRRGEEKTKEKIVIRDKKEIKSPEHQAKGFASKVTDQTYIYSRVLWASGGAGCVLCPSAAVVVVAVCSLASLHLGIV